MAPVVMEMPEVDQFNLGGTMRLGSRRTNIQSNTVAFKIYNGKLFTMERHRHRYEINPKYINDIQSSGLLFTGTAEKLHDGDKTQRMEIIELQQNKILNTTSLEKTNLPEKEKEKEKEKENEKGNDVTHPFFFAVQFHPEFLSRPLVPSPPFLAFIQASSKHRSTPTTTTKLWLS